MCLSMCVSERHTMHCTTREIGERRHCNEPTRWVMPSYIIRRTELCIAIWTHAKCLLFIWTWTCHPPRRYFLSSTCHQCCKIVAVDKIIHIPSAAIVNRKQQLRMTIFIFIHIPSPAALTSSKPMSEATVVEIPCVAGTTMWWKFRRHYAMTLTLVRVSVCFFNCVHV